MTKRIHRELDRLLDHENPRVVTAAKESIRSLYSLHIKTDKKKKSKEKPR